MHRRALRSLAIRKALYGLETLDIKDISGTLVS